jgi:hypothetical protein
MYYRTSTLVKWILSISRMIFWGSYIMMFYGISNSIKKAYKAALKQKQQHLDHP